MTYQQDVDGGAQGQEEVRDEGEDLYPARPVEADLGIDEGIDQLEGKKHNH